MTMSTENITRENLSQFHGGGERFFNPMFHAIEYTEGVAFLNRNGAGWLVDAILSHLIFTRKVRAENFVCITLVVKADKNLRHSAKLIFTDGNDDTPVLARQNIEYTDFPLVGEIKFFATDRTLMLASEY